jgi:ribosomal protein S18 acetylase RimI-like enzyme
METKIRLMEERDIDFALAQTGREGWDIADGGFQMHMKHDPAGCFIAERDGRRIAMITTTRYGRSAFIGNLIVEPSSRRQGIGEMLMRRAMDHLRQQGVQRLALEADPPGVKLYRRLGFTDAFQSLRFEATSRVRPAAGEVREVEPLTADNLKEMARFDAHHFGDDRSRILAALLPHAPAAFCLRRDGAPAGYIITQPIDDGVRLGPAVAVNEEAAAALLDAVLARLEVARFTAGVPAPNHHGARVLRARGFEPGTPCLRMVCGKDAYHGRPEQILAIAGGDRG